MKPITVTEINRGTKFTLKWRQLRYTCAATCEWNRVVPVKFDVAEKLIVLITFSTQQPW